MLSSTNYLGDLSGFSGTGLSLHNHYLVVLHSLLQSVEEVHNREFLAILQNRPVPIRIFLTSKRVVLRFVDNVGSFCVFKVHFQRWACFARK